jgi:hypothetical protein
LKGFDMSTVSNNQTASTNATPQPSATVGATTYPQQVLIPLAAPYQNKPLPVGSLNIAIGIGNQAGDQVTLSSDPLIVKLDTGSCGLVIPAHWLYQAGTYQCSTPPAGSAQLPPTGNLLPGVTLTSVPGEVIYYPSTDSYHGFYYTIETLALGVGDGKAAAMVNNIIVLGVVNDNPMLMGIGFDRTIIADNPFLHAPKNPAGQALYPSFYLDNKQVILGMVPPADVAYQNLKSVTPPKPLPPAALPFDLTCCTMPSGTFGFSPAGSTPGTPVQTGVLLDTGVGLMMVSNLPGFTIPGMKQPSGAPPAQNLCGNTVTVTVTGTALNYSFPLVAQNAGQGEPAYTTANIAAGNDGANTPPGVAPSLVMPIQNGGVPFLNTGVNPLFGWGMLFDALNSRIGFISVQATPTGGAGG